MSPLASPRPTIADPWQTPQRATAPPPLVSGSRPPRSAIAGAIARPAQSAPAARPAASSSNVLGCRHQKKVTPAVPNRAQQRQLAPPFQRVAQQDRREPDRAEQQAEPA